ncbi:hypothetical protein ACIPJN_31855 [Streptomyces sp. NPDC086796]|uniref:hypothetical protein n=1 Tax=unclassified Streptomyces TaxID=2593676 RepID=UPI003823E4A9
MPAKDESALRRYEKLVDRLEGLMRAPLGPRDRDCRGSPILSGGDLEGMGGLKVVRCAAREGPRLGW